MSDVISPTQHPVLAAQQVLLEIIKAGGNPIGNESQGQHTAKGLIALHEQLTAYYRTLPGAQ
ncbi:hypothetical protein [Pseudomonas fluvialis]|uniref:hypothetical protein n=1 Tax=Pseudomonas fluvialis TaxID=1793966 RepID=UPI0035AF02E3